MFFTGRNTAFVNFNMIVNTFFIVTSRKEETKNTLIWIHKVFSNLKQKLLEIYHIVTY